MEITLLMLPPIITALVEVVKRTFSVTGSVRDNYIPVLNVVIGVLLGVIYLEGEPKYTVLMGALAGLSAGGLYDLVKNPIKAIGRRMR